MSSKKKYFQNKKKNRESSNNNWGPGYTSMSIAVQPRPKPMHKFSRTVEERYDLSSDGINPTLSALVFTLDQLPDYTDFTNLYQLYRIRKVKLEWTPEYTELTDAALVSNAVNVYFNSALDQTNSSTPTSVQQVLQYQNCKSTSIVRKHERMVEVSALMGVMPCNCYISTQNPSERHYGIKVAIAPTGVAMTFRSRADRKSVV